MYYIHWIFAFWRPNAEIVCVLSIFGRIFLPRKDQLSNWIRSEGEDVDIDFWLIYFSELWFLYQCKVTTSSNLKWLQKQLTQWTAKYPRSWQIFRPKMAILQFYFEFSMIFMLNIWFVFYTRLRIIVTSGWCRKNSSNFIEMTALPFQHSSSVNSPISTVGS